MTYLSIIEKFKILFTLLLDYKYILAFMILLIIITFFYSIKKINTKKYILFTSILFILVFCISIISNYKILTITFDNFTTLLFRNIYFPSIYVYISVLVLSFITFITSMLNITMKRIYKVINTIMFIINNVLFVIILNIIARNKIDIFSINSLYTNTELVVMLELSMGLCILWILALIISYTTNIINEMLTHKKTIINKEENLNLVLDINLPKENLVEEIINEQEENNIINSVNQDNRNNIIQEEAIIETIVNTEEEIIVENNIEENIIFETENSVEKSNLTFNDILNECVPIKYYEYDTIDEQYTLFDPQKNYEDNYNKIKNEMLDAACLNDLIEIDETTVIQNTSLSEEISYDEKLTNDVKKEELKEKSNYNTISINDLINDEQPTINEMEIVNSNIALKQDNETNYTVEDYKKMVEMLNSIKSHYNDSNINIDDAVAISLIRNYSIEECLKFKNILEDNLS